MLPSMLRHGVISTCFAGDIDLGYLIGKGFDTVRDALNQLVPNESPRAKNTLARFLNIQPVISSR